MNWLFLPAQTAPVLAPDLPLYWLPETGEGAWLRLDQCAEQCQGQPLTLVLPLEACSAFAVNLPPSKARWLRQALPYAVEELLAEDVEQLHLALGEQLADGRYRVLAIRHGLLAGWLQQLSDLGLPVTAIYCDADLLPHDGRQLLFIGERGLLGGAQAERLVFDRARWPELAEHCAEVTQAYGVDDQGPAELPIYQQVSDPYRLLAAGAANGLDMAQGEFVLRNDSNHWRRWRPLLIAGVACLVLQYGFNLAQGWYLQGAADQYAADSRALYQQLFPQDQRIVNLRAQFDNHLAQSSTQSAGRFLLLLGQAAPAFAPAQAKGLAIEQLDYSDGSGDLALQVRVNDFPSLEQLRQGLSETGLAVQLGSASRESDGIKARVVLGGPL